MLSRLRQGDQHLHPQIVSQIEGSSNIYHPSQKNKDSPFLKFNIQRNPHIHPAQSNIQYQADPTYRQEVNSDIHLTQPNIEYQRDHTFQKEVNNDFRLPRPNIEYQGDHTFQHQNIEGNIGMHLPEPHIQFQGDQSFQYASIQGNIETPQLQVLMPDNLNNRRISQPEIYRHMSRPLSKDNIQSHCHYTSQKPYQCRCCKQSFPVQWESLRDQRTLTGEKPYKCIVCCQMFSEIEELEYHKASHVKGITYPCLYCDLSFITKQHLDKEAAYLGVLSSA